MRWGKPSVKSVILKNLTYPTKYLANSALTSIGQNKAKISFVFWMMGEIDILFLRFTDL